MLESTDDNLELSCISCSGQDTKDLIAKLRFFLQCFTEGEDQCYGGVSMSTIIEKGYGVGGVISLLWFKRSLPHYCTQFIEVGYSIVQSFL